MNKFLLFLLVFLPLAIASCGNDKDEPNQSTTSDPPGTITTNLPNTFHAVGNGYYEDGIDMYNTNACLGLNKANNLEAAGWYYGEITSVGKVSNLSSITKIPSNGWANEAAALPGYGYIYRFKDYSSDWRYARIYVVDYMKNTSGGIIGVTIKYQKDWTP